VSRDNPFLRGRLIVTVLVAATLFAIAATLETSSEPPPITFNHQAMVGAGVPCLFCHSDARRSPAAGIPSMEKCMGCHKVILTEDENIQILADYWQRQEPILWQRYLQLPRFVYFSHRVHVAVAGLNCENCHGAVGRMTVARPVFEINMGFCLDCHHEQDNAGQLSECVVCHQ
jgi:hypothetical protein